MKKQKKVTRPVRRSLQIERLEDRLALAITSLQPASVISGTGTTGDDQSFGGSVSADGRYTAFMSEATNLSPGNADTPDTLDVFLFDAETKSVTLVSRANGSNAAGNGPSTSPAISADGNFIVYASEATNLVAGQVDTAGTQDLFLFNRSTGQTILVSRLDGPGNEAIAANGASGSAFLPEAAAISADGRFVTFKSQATDLVSGVGDNNFQSDVFLFDRADNSIRLVSRSAVNTTDTASSESLTPVISADGRFVAYTSFSSDLVQGQNDVNGHADVFLWDRLAQANFTQLVSGANGDIFTTANGPTFSDGEIDISEDGQFVVFKTFATNLMAGVTDENNNSDVYIFDRLANPGNNLRLVSHLAGDILTAATGGSASSATPVISANGRYVAYASSAQNLAGTDQNNEVDVFLFDRTTNINTLVSHASGPNPNASAASAAGSSRLPFISASGDFVAYTSDATNLVPAQGNPVPGDNVFVYSRVDNTSLLISGDAGSDTLAAGGVGTDISDNGLAVAFTSLSNVVAGDDENGQLDVYVRRTIFPTFSFRAETLTTDENGGKVRIRVDRGGDTSVAAGVSIRLFGDTTQEDRPLVSALEDRDFVAGTFSLIFAPDETTQVFEATLLDDRAAEADETFRAELVDPSPGSVVGTPNVTTITIVDNDGLGLISVNHVGTATGNGGSFDVRISSDGRFVAFNSKATDLVEGIADTNDSDDVFWRDRLTNETFLVSRNSAGTAAANEFAQITDMSPDGRFVVFNSFSTDLVPNQSSSFGNNVFVWDALTKTVRLVSGVDGSEALAGNRPSIGGTISDDGQFVAFNSLANNLIDGVSDTNVTPDLAQSSAPDVFVRDMLNNTVTLVSRSLSGNATANSESVASQISGDGKYVTFISRATDLVEGVSDTNGQVRNFITEGDEIVQIFVPGNDVFVWERETETVSLVSKSATGNAAGNKESGEFAISRDGMHIAFVSGASNLDSTISDLNDTGDVFLHVRNPATGAATTKLISRSATAPQSGNEGAGGSVLLLGKIDITDDGRHVMYNSNSTNLVTDSIDDNSGLGTDVFRYSVDADSNKLVSLSADGDRAESGIGTSISADGRFISYIAASAEHSHIEVFLRDMQSNESTLISTDTSPGSSRSSSRGTLSANGQFVAFQSDALGLVDLPDANDGDANFRGDIFVSPGAFEPGTFEFASVDVSVVENEDQALLTINRTGGTNGAVFVFFEATITGNGLGHAQALQDFTTVSSSVLFRDGETTATIGIPLRDDQADEGSETFKVTLTNPADRLGNNTTATVTIVDNDTEVENVVVKKNGDSVAQIIEEDGDIVTLTLKAPGTLAITLDDPDGNGRGPIQVALSGTTATKSTLTFKVTKKGGDGFANVRTIRSDGGLKSLAGAQVNLIGDGLESTEENPIPADLDIFGTLVSLALRDVANGADIKLGGNPTEFNKLTLRDVGNGTDVNVGSGINSLTAARIGNGFINAPSLQTLNVKGAARVKATKTTPEIPAVPGDISAKVFLSGAGIPAGKDTLKKVTIAHDMIDAIFAVVGGAGNIGTVTINGRMIRSGITAGYELDLPFGLLTPLEGDFGTALNIKSVTVNDKKKEGPAFETSLIAATRIGTVTLQSIDESAVDPFTTLPIQYGVLADTSIAKVTVKEPKVNKKSFIERKILISAVDEVFARFHIKVGTDD